MSRGSSGLVRALIIILYVANCLGMSAGAMLLRTGSQSVLVHRTAPVMVLMVLFSCTSTRLVCAEFFQSVQSPVLPPSNRGPRLMFEEFLHLLPSLSDARGTDRVGALANQSKTEGGVSPAKF